MPAVTESQPGLCHFPVGIMKPTEKKIIYLPVHTGNRMGFFSDTLGPEDTRQKTSCVAGRGCGALP